jgi:hypothetical protein
MKRRVKRRGGMNREESIKLGSGTGKAFAQIREPDKTGLSHPQIRGGFFFRYTQNLGSPAARKNQKEKGEKKKKRKQTVEPLIMLTQIIGSLLFFSFSFGKRGPKGPAKNSADLFPIE